MCCRKGNSGKAEKLRTCFKRQLDEQKNATSGEGSRKRRKYLHFGQLLFLLPHLEDRETQNNLTTQTNEDEEETNSSQEEEEEEEEEEERERPRNVRKNEAKRNFLRGIITADFATEKKMDDTDVDGDKCFLLFQLPSSRLFNDGKQFLVRLGIKKIMRHVQLQQNFDTYLLLAFFSNADSVGPNSPHFAINPLSTISNFYAEFRNSVPVLVQLLSRDSNSTKFHNCPTSVS